MAEKITGKIAAILNSREVAINVGSDSGVTPGMKFAVLSDAPLTIQDPDSHEVLDTVDREKVRVEAVDIRPRLTVCRTYETRVIAGSPLYDIIGRTSVFGPPRREVPITLSFEDDSAIPSLSEEESYVNIGDRVEQIIRD